VNKSCIWHNTKAKNSTFSSFFLQADDANAGGNFFSKKKYSYSTS